MILNIIIGLEIIQLVSEMSRENSPYIHIERTLLIIKPDIINYADKIEELILQKGFLIIQVNIDSPECITKIDAFDRRDAFI